jgi:hypothetical protein
MFVRTRPQWGGGLRCQTGKTARAIRVSASSEPQTKATEPGQVLISASFCTVLTEYA